MKHIWEMIKVGAEILFMLFVAFVIYGLVTDCPGTADIYVFCGG